ncbi:Holliday junction branch migration protein RuvA [Rhizosphaericola mali]|uniref:Holliday junction branch migration complex subunit RuvA n=1 Tax=Rhizosphaericola mali TaxID=2545455 RepID=A0A5P2GEU6_9BACT|nr:Holliday junction branch migration protein RuvA [Rhizosphaericola mali]QES90121.1 Holliday junction branch migration protein RuvA [Rhizosphaericola mali]
MIAYLRGKFLHLTPAQLIVDVNGVGYELNISLNTYTEIQSKQEGALYAYQHITENAQTMYGFFSLEEKKLFLQLIGVSGIGSSTARMMLSGLAPDEIVRAIVQGNVKQLEGIKGIGKKTAERLIVELKDKLSKTYDDEKQSIINQPNSRNNEQDALEALIALGIARPMAEKAIQKSAKTLTDPNVETLIKAALKNM